MNKLDAVLAIDTSNYTTSLSLMTTKGELIANLKEPLPVKPGERGLRQSDAVFAHTVNIPKLMARVREYLSDYQVVAVGVSEKPRNCEGSYMPCFLSGVAAAESVSTSLGVPIYRFSHQCGHIMAAVYSAGRDELLGQSFAAFHVSGGTTELVRVTPQERGFSTELIGGTLDLNAGQIIDRIGVYMGLKFPAGPALEELAKKNEKPVPKKKISLVDTSVNLSGLENMAIKLYRDTDDASLTAAFVFDFIGRSLVAMSDAYEDKYGKSTFVYAGGVMCNSIIKNMLKTGRDCSFAEPAMSADNAVGIAALTVKAYNSEKLNGHFSAS